MAFVASYAIGGQSIWKSQFVACWFHFNVVGYPSNRTVELGRHPQFSIISCYREAGIQQLARAGHLSPEILKERYYKELRPNLVSHEARQ